MERIELTLETNGFCGCYFKGDKYPNFVIIRVAGSGAPKEKVISCSQFLIDAGYNVLCLGYYMWGNLGNTISEIPIDYVENAITWIKEYTGNNKIKIGMTGISQGAQYTLVAASLLADIGCIAVASPFEYIYEGNNNFFKRTGHSSYTFHGKELPYTEWRLLDTNIVKLLICCISDKNYGLSRMMRYGYDKNGVNAKSVIKIENMNADVLLLASANDDCWPSDVAVERMVERLKESNYAHKIESHIYEKGCHNMGGNMTITGKTGKKMKKLMRSWSDHPEECMACIEESKMRILNFFEIYVSNKFRNQE